MLAVWKIPAFQPGSNVRLEVGSIRTDLTVRAGETSFVEIRTKQ